jgi:hypothetical protein
MGLIGILPTGACMRRLPLCEFGVYRPTESNPSGDELCGEPAQYLLEITGGARLHLCAVHAEKVWEDQPLEQQV